MKQQIKVGVVCFARKTFDYEAAADLYSKIQEKLSSISNIDLKIVPELVIEVQDARDAATWLVKDEIDGLICISGTFALGNLVLELNKILHTPLLLWGLDELPYDGGKIRLNSVCGLNLNASNLYKAGVKNFHIIIGQESPEDWLDALRIKKALYTAHVGIIGYRAKGFFNLAVDELDLYNQTGILIDHYELETLFDQDVTEEDIVKRKAQIEEKFDLSGVSDSQVLKVAVLAAKFDEFLAENQLTNIAIRCWPEFAAMFGVSPCAAMSLLQAEEKILTCEGDILGSLSQLAHAAIGGETPFLADFSQINFEENFALLWHCGVAPCNLWDGKCVRSLDTYFAGGKGVTADFVLKEGAISLARIDYAPGEYRIFLHTGTVEPMTKDLRGTYMKAKFPDNVRKVLDKIVYNGIAHHISVVYGSFIEPFKLFGKLMGWKIIQ